MTPFDVQIFSFPSVFSSLMWFLHEYRFELRRRAVFAPRLCCSSVLFCMWSIRGNAEVKEDSFFVGLDMKKTKNSLGDKMLPATQVAETIKSIFCHFPMATWAIWMLRGRKKKNSTKKGGGEDKTVATAKWGGSNKKIIYPGQHTKQARCLD